MMLLAKLKNKDFWLEKNFCPPRRATEWRISENQPGTPCFFGKQ